MEIYPVDQFGKHKNHIREAMKLVVLQQHSNQVCECHPLLQKQEAIKIGKELLSLSPT